MKAFNAAILGRPRTGKTTLANAFLDYAKTHHGTSGVIGNVATELGVKDSHLLRLRVGFGDVDANFFWAPGPLFYPKQTYEKLLQLGTLLVYVFDDIHPDQKDCFEMHQSIAASISAKAKPWTWLFVQNRRPQVSADIPREPLPSALGTQVLTADFKQASEVTTLITGIIREGRKQLTLQ